MKINRNHGKMRTYLYLPTYVYTYVVQTHFPHTRPKNNSYRVGKATGGSPTTDRPEKITSNLKTNTH